MKARTGLHRIGQRLSAWIAAVLLGAAASAFAADEAVKASGLSVEGEAQEMVGTIIGVGLGGLPMLEAMGRTLVEKMIEAIHSTGVAPRHASVNGPCRRNMYTRLRMVIITVRHWLTLVQQ